MNIFITTRKKAFYVKFPLLETYRKLEKLWINWSILNALILVASTLGSLLTNFNSPTSQL